MAGGWWLEVRRPGPFGPGKEFRIGLDTGDLAEMQTSADTAYRAARTSLGGLPRVLAWLRWPLT